MAKIVGDVARQNLHDADEVRETEKGRAEIVRLAGTSVARITLEPGWRWSEHLKPVMGTESCEVKHLLYLISGRMHVRMDDGEELTLEPGDLASIAPGHEARVEGDEPAVMLELQSGELIAKGAEAQERRAA